MHNKRSIFKNNIRWEYQSDNLDLDVLVLIFVVIWLRYCLKSDIVGSTDLESSQQLQMWFSEHFFAPKLAAQFVKPIVSAPVERKWREKMSEKPHSIGLLR